MDNPTSGTGFCKFPDGTLICWGDASIPNNTDRSSAVIPYPQAFTAQPSISLTYKYSSSTSLPPLRSFNTSVNGFQPLVSPKNTTGDAFNLWWIAVGRWK